MKKDVRNASWDSVYNSTNVNTALENFNSILKDIFDKHAPLIEKRIKGKSCPWLNDAIKKQMNAAEIKLTKMAQIKKGC